MNECYMIIKIKKILILNNERDEKFEYLWFNM